MFMMSLRRFLDMHVKRCRQIFQVC